MKPIFAMFPPVLLAVLSIVGCGSDGGSAAASSTSSSGGTESVQPAPNCGAVCTPEAIITFDEPNDGSRLDDALIEACQGDRCVSGTLRSNGGAYEVALRGDGQSKFAISPTIEPTGTALRFTFRWIGTTMGASVVDGDTYTITASSQDDGGAKELFKRSFTATYADKPGPCGSTCKAYRSPGTND